MSVCVCVRVCLLCCDPVPGTEEGLGQETMACK